MMATMMIEFQNVTREFQGPTDKVTALTDVSFGLEAGEFVAVVGPSGCGKSTLLLTAGALLTPSSGTVMLDGSNVYRKSGAVRRQLRARKVGFVFQQFHLLPYLTVYENILAPSVALPSPDAPKRAAELVERFGLTDRAQHVPAQLSTGEKQRTALARALLNRPLLLLADEPTGNLDPENGQTVLQALAEFAQAGGAVLMVTHEQGATEMTHRTLRLVNGRLQDS